MSWSNPYFEDKKIKLSDGEGSSGKNSKKADDDNKPNVKMTSKSIKKEPGILVAEIKCEPDLVNREIKKESCQPDAKLVMTKHPKLQSGVRRKRKRKATRTGKTGKKISTTAKKQSLKKYKKSLQRTKTKSCNGSLVSKKSSKKRINKTKKKSRNNSKSPNSTCSKKKEVTLLDRQNSSSLRLFGFRDELEYFSLEEDHKEVKEISQGSGNAAKRTSLTSLEARKKVLLALKSHSQFPSLKSKPVIQPPLSKNFDLLGSILDSQTLWHSKNSHMKVNDDGSVEVFKRNKNQLMETKLTSDKEISLWSSNTSRMGSTQKRNGSGFTRLTDIEREPRESLILSSNMESLLTKTNIKSETCELTEAWDAETVVDENEQISEEKFKTDIIKKEKNLQKLALHVSPREMSSDDEGVDFPTFSKEIKKPRKMSYDSKELDFEPPETEQRGKIKGKEELSTRDGNHREEKPKELRKVGKESLVLSLKRDIKKEKNCDEMHQVTDPMTRLAAAQGHPSKSTSTSCRIRSPILDNCRRKS